MKRTNISATAGRLIFVCLFSMVFSANASEYLNPQQALPQSFQSMADWSDATNVREFFAQPGKTTTEGCSGDGQYRVIQSDGSYGSCTSTVVCPAVAPATCYYIDGDNGDDSNSGLSLDNALKTFDRMGWRYNTVDPVSGPKIKLNSGDFVFVSGRVESVRYFVGGSEWQDRALLRGIIGTPTAPVTIAALPGAESATIQGLLITQSEHIRIEGQAQPFLHLSNDGFDGTRHACLRVGESVSVYADNLLVSDCEGAESSANNPSGVYLSALHDFSLRTSILADNIHEHNQNNAQLVIFGKLLNAISDGRDLDGVGYRIQEVLFTADGFNVGALKLKHTGGKDLTGEGVVAQVDDVFIEACSTPGSDVCLGGAHPGHHTDNAVVLSSHGAALSWRDLGGTSQIDNLRVRDSVLLALDGSACISVDYGKDHPTDWPSHAFPTDNGGQVVNTVCGVSGVDGQRPSIRIYNSDHLTQSVWDEASWAFNDVCFVSDNDSTDHVIEYFGTDMSLDEAAASGLVSNYRTGTFSVAADGSVVIDGCDEPTELPAPVLTATLIPGTRQISVEVTYPANSNFNQLRGWPDGSNSFVIWEGTDDTYSTVYEVPAGVDTMQFTARYWSPAGDQSEVASVEIVMPDSSYCNGLAVTVDLGSGQTPTSGDDVILGTEADDVITGGGGGRYDLRAGGDDTIYGNGGADWIDGGDGVDKIVGGSGNDELYTGAGSTVGTGILVLGGGGDDIIYGGPDADELRGGSGKDTLYGMGGDDIIHGNAGDDWIDGGQGVDSINAGGGDDEIHTGAGGTVGTGYRVLGGSGHDTIYGGPDADELRGGRGDDTLHGDGGDDQIRGDGGRDSLYGEDGDDYLTGGTSADTCDGGAGADVAICESVVNVP